jgi:hypothetical protein
MPLLLSCFSEYMKFKPVLIISKDVSRKILINFGFIFILDQKEEVDANSIFCKKESFSRQSNKEIFSLEQLFFEQNEKCFTFN